MYEIKQKGKKDSGIRREREGRRERRRRERVNGKVGGERDTERKRSLPF